MRKRYITALLLFLGVSVAASGRLGDGSPDPDILSLVASPSTVTLAPGETAQITLTAVFDDSSSRDVTTDPNLRRGTVFDYEEEPYTIDSTGLLTALIPGDYFVSFVYSGWLTSTEFASVDVEIRSPDDRDADGLPNDWEASHGFDPDFPGDGQADTDDDALRNIEELKYGTDPLSSDTDGDGWDDGSEVSVGRDPLVPDLPPLPPAKPLNENCVVSVLNRSAQVDEKGIWVLPNVPANLGQVRLRATCVENGEVRSGQSEFITIPPSGILQVANIDFDEPQPIPVALTVSAPSAVLSAVGETVQITVSATLPDASVVDVTLANTGTSYRTSNSDIATITSSGLVTAVKSGMVLISAVNEGALGLLSLSVTLSGDTDGDGLPDDFELANGLDPNDPADAFLDHDQDGLSTLAEFQQGLDPFDEDSDDDGLLDGEEVNVYGTNPLLFDTDGDGLSDGLEVQTGSDPLDGNDFNLTAALDSMEVAPASFTIVFNTVLGEASRQLVVMGQLIDGTSLDITSSFYGTSYGSSDLTVANFGADPGRAFAGLDGSATITASNSGFSAAAQVEVESFAPVALSYLGLGGKPEAVTVDGSYAFVSMGSPGVKIVDVSDPEAPFVARTFRPFSLPPFLNYFAALDVAVQGTIAYVAVTGGLSVVDVSDPVAASQISFLRNPLFVVEAVAVRGSLAFLGGDGGLVVVDISDPAEPLILGSLVTATSVRDVVAMDEVVLLATGTDGVQVVDVSDPTAPAEVGSTHLSSNNRSKAAGLAVQGRRALVADGLGWSPGGLRMVDLADPANPFVAGTTTDEFGLRAVAWDGNLVLAADYFFRNAVPIFQVTDGDPLFRAVVDFSQAPSFRDDNGLDIAVGGGLVYLVANEGRHGHGGLHIGRYLIPFDGEGIVPTVEIISPENGDLVPEREFFTVEAQAMDDIFVESVTLLVDGEPVRTDYAAPYSAQIPVPEGQASITVSAVARDAGGNETASELVILGVATNPSPVARILTPLPGASEQEEVRIPVVVEASDDVEVLRVEFFADGVLFATDDRAPAFSAMYTIPLGAAEVDFTALAYDELGPAPQAGPVTVTVVPDNPPEVQILEPDVGTELVEGALVEILVGVADDVGIDRVAFFRDGSLFSIDPNGPGYSSFLTVPTAGTPLSLFVVARDSRGQETTSATVTPVVVLDPLTGVSGIVVDINNVPLNGAEVTVATDSGTLVTAVTGSDGSFTVSGLPTTEGFLTLEASGSLLGEELFALVDSIVPVPGSTVDVGTVALAYALAGTEVVGVVEDELGTPVAGALVRVHNRYEKREALSGADGSFHIPRIPIATRPAIGAAPILRLYVSAFATVDGTPSRGKAPGPLFPVLPGPTDAGTLVLAASPTGDLGTDVTGSVQDEFGGAIVGAEVSISSDFDLSETTSGIGGLYSVPSLPALDGDLFATAEALRIEGLVTSTIEDPILPVGGSATDLGVIEFPVQEGDDDDDDGPCDPCGVEEGVS